MNDFIIHVKNYSTKYKQMSVLESNDYDRKLLK